MLGIGLGGFAQGFERGAGLGERLHKQQRQRKQDAAFDGAQAQGRADHDAAVARGEAQPGDPDAIMRYTLPRMVAPLIQAGDMKGAEAARSWAEADTTRRATRLFGQGMLAGQAGDMNTAVARFVEAGRIQGYGGGYTISDPEPIEGGGLRVRIGRDGQEFVQEFRTPDEVLRFGATWLNPEAAYQQWQQAQAAAAQRQGKVDDALATHRGKKEIEREDAIHRQRLNLGAKQTDPMAVRKQVVAELTATGQIGTMSDISPQQQERLIERRVQQLLGRPAGGATPAAPGVIVDTRTGRPVDGPSRPAPAPVAPQQAAPVATPASAPGPAAQPAAGIGTATEPAAAKENSAPGIGAPQRAASLFREMIRRQGPRQGPEAAPAAADPATPEPESGDPIGRTVRQVLEEHEEYRALQAQVARLPRNSPEGRRIRERMREIEAEIRAAG